MSSSVSGSASISFVSLRCLSKQWFDLRGPLARTCVWRWSPQTRIRHRSSSWRCNPVSDLSGRDLGKPVSRTSQRFLSTPGSPHHLLMRSNSRRLGHFASDQCLLKSAAGVLRRLRLLASARHVHRCMRLRLTTPCKAESAPAWLLLCSPIKQ